MRVYEGPHIAQHYRPAQRHSELLMG